MTGETMDLGFDYKSARKKIDKGVIRQKTCTISKSYSTSLVAMSEMVGEEKSALIKIFIMELTEGKIKKYIRMKSSTEMNVTGYTFYTFSVSDQCACRLEELSKQYGHNEEYILRAAIYWGLSEHFKDTVFEKSEK